MAAPLKGRRILDLGAVCTRPPHGLAASFAAKLCADYGAEVVRPLPRGEPLESCAPSLPTGGSALDLFLNRGKHLGPPQGRFDAAIGDTDAIGAHPEIPIHVRISVLSPGEDPVSTELAVLALSGLLDMIGDPDGPPARLAGHQLAYAAGLAASTGLLAALRTGRRDIVEVSLFDVATWLNWKALVGLLVLGRAPDRRRPTNLWTTLRAKDGHIALVFQGKDWPALKAMVGDPALDEPRFATTTGRAQNRHALLAVLRPWFAARTRADITAEAQSRRIPIGPVLWPSELLQDAQYRARGFLESDGTPRLPVIWDGRRLPRGRSDAH